MGRRMRGTLMGLVSATLMVASLAFVVDGSLGHATARAAVAASTGPPMSNSAWTRRRQLSPSGLGMHNEELLSLDKVMRLRGGVKRAAVKTEEDEDDADEDGDVAEGSGAVSALTGVFANMPPATRVYVMLLLLITAVDVSVGKAIDSSNTFGLDWGKTIKGLNLWRPLTSLIYLGPLSMSWLTNVYFLTQHGTRLELVSGTAEQVIFLLVVGSLLLMLGPLIGMSFLSTPMVAAHTYVSARMDPLGQVQFQFLRIPMWTLPFAQMGAAVLQEEGQPMAAIPHLVGILCGHVYHFFTVVHPLMGAKRRLGAPAWMKRRLDGGDNPNFMQSSGDDEPPAPRGRKIGAGKKKATKAPRDAKKSAKKEQTKARPVPEFPTSSCS